MNELLWAGLLLGSFAGILLAYRLFGKTGLYVWTALAVIVANIQVMRTVALFGYVTALGNAVYGTTFLATDILAEKYGERDARKAVLVGLFTILAATGLIQLCLFFTPHESDVLAGSLETVFGFLPRIAGASVAAYLVSQLFDVWFFARLKKATGGRRLWLRNNLSTMVSQLIDNLVFTAIAFTGVYPFEVILSIFLTSYALKWVVAALDTPFVYWAKRIDPLD